MEINENRKRIKQAFQQKKIKAICGYPGIGKTYLARHYEGFADSYLSCNLYTDKEKDIKNPFFPGNYIKVCNGILNQDKIIVTAMSDEARFVFRNFLNINYLLIYPNETEKERYFNIYDTRNDENEWIDLNKRVWDEKIERIKNFVVPEGCYKDEIPVGMSLAEYLTELGIL